MMSVKSSISFNERGDDSIKGKLYIVLTVLKFMNFVTSAPRIYRQTVYRPRTVIRPSTPKTRPHQWQNKNKAATTNWHIAGRDEWRFCGQKGKN
jgi:hypothetical protein